MISLFTEPRQSLPATVRVSFTKCIADVPEKLPDAALPMAALHKSSALPAPVLVDVATSGAAPMTH